MLKSRTTIFPSACFRFSFSTFQLFSFLFCTLAPAADSYKLGDVATQEVVTPVALTVINPETTEALREKEALKVPLVIRFRAQTADEAEAALRAAFALARSNFTDTLYRTMKGKPEDERAIGGPLFMRAVESARKHADGFPLMEELAPVWARDESGAAIENELADKLRATLTLPIIAGKAPSLFNSKNSIALVPVNYLDRQPTPEETTKLRRIVKGSQLTSLAAARSQLLKSFPEAGQSRARFAAKFLTTNSQPDVELTQVLRSRRTEGLCATDNYEAAEVIVRKGQVVDRKTLAALNTMREKSLIGTLQNQLVQEKIEKVVVETSSQRNAWIAAGTSALAFLSILIVWRARSRRRRISVPVLAGAGFASGEEDWRERAILAEARAEQAKHAMRSGFLHWMREKLVQGLFSQRAELLSSQQKAEAEMHALEQRLEQLHTPLQERIRAYEGRIGELEKDLAVKGEENRELIKAKITLAKNQLTVERERGRGGFGTN